MGTPLEFQVFTPEGAAAEGAVKSAPHVGKGRFAERRHASASARRRLCPAYIESSQVRPEAPGPSASPRLRSRATRANSRTRGYSLSSSRAKRGGRVVRQAAEARARESGGSDRTVSPTAFS